MPLVSENHTKQSINLYEFRCVYMNLELKKKFFNGNF